VAPASWIPRRRRVKSASALSGRCLCLPVASLARRCSLSLMNPRKNSVAFLSSPSAELFQLCRSGLGMCALVDYIWYVSAMQLGHVCAWHGCFACALPNPQRFLPPTQHAWPCGKCVVSQTQTLRRSGAFRALHSCMFPMRACCYCQCLVSGEWPSFSFFFCLFYERFSPLHLW
jgi:hypothetical protein